MPWTHYLHQRHRPVHLRYWEVPAAYSTLDLAAAIVIVKHGNAIASQHRKRTSFVSRLTSFIHAPSVSWVKSMNAIERHAELTYAETLFEEAILGIVYSGDWLQFIKEALHMRTCVQTYRLLWKYIQTMDDEAVAAAKDPHDSDIDNDFRSGVYLGVGLTHILLSLLPKSI
ncbi:hypothetical protein M422DRAFT_786125, partial [Sphaerobolus stellatus SS14]